MNKEIRNLNAKEEEKVSGGELDEKQKEAISGFKKFFEENYCEIHKCVKCGEEYKYCRPDGMAPNYQDYLRKTHCPKCCNEDLLYKSGYRGI